MFSCCSIKQKSGRIHLKFMGFEPIEREDFIVAGQFTSLWVLGTGILSSKITAAINWGGRGNNFEF